MEAGIARQFWMEDRHHDAAVADQGGAPVDGREHLHPETDPFDHGRPDAYGMERGRRARRPGCRSRTSRPDGRRRCDGPRGRSPRGSAGRADRRGLRRQEDRPGTGAEHGTSALGELSRAVRGGRTVRPSSTRRRLATRDDETVDVGEVRGVRTSIDRGAERSEQLGMEPERALQGQDSDFSDTAQPTVHLYRPRKPIRARGHALDCPDTPPGRGSHASSPTVVVAGPMPNRDHPRHVPPRLSRLVRVGRDRDRRRRHPTQGGSGPPVLGR